MTDRDQNIGSAEISKPKFTQEAVFPERVHQERGAHQQQFIDSRLSLRPNDGEDENSDFDEAELAQFISTQLNEISAPEPDVMPVDVNGAEDVDSDEDDVVNAEIEQPTLAIESLQLTSNLATPSLLSTTAEDATMAPTANIHEVHDRYSSYLISLCDGTDTTPMLSHTIEGLSHILHKIQPFTLRENHSGAEKVDLSAFALVVYVWQLVCLRRLYNSFPSHMSLVSIFGAYTLAGHSILDQRAQFRHSDFVRAIRQWETTLLKVIPRWSDDLWLPKVPDLNPTLTIHRNATADSYLKALEGGKAELGSLIIREDARSVHHTKLRAFTKPKARLHILGQVISILASLDDELLTALIDGTLPRKAEIPEGRIHNALADVQKHSGVSPAIYMNCICDGMGISPTPRQWQMVCAQIKVYLGRDSMANDLAAKVDMTIQATSSWPRSRAKSGLRRYTDFSTPFRPSFSQERRQKVLKFVSEMEKRIQPDLNSGRQDVPLSAPVVEVGFSINVLARLEQHSKHQNSNYIMNLAEAMLRHLYGRSFRLQQSVIFTCWEPEHPWFSEIVLTQLAQGYTEWAGGFSHAAAGESNRGAYDSFSERTWVPLRHHSLATGHILKELDKINKQEKRKLKELREGFAREDALQAKTHEYLVALNEALDVMVEIAMLQLAQKRRQEMEDAPDST